MARRYIPDEPTSRLAIWARRMALFSLATAFLSIIIVRSGVLEIKPALATFAGSMMFATLALMLAVAAFVAIWQHGYGGMGLALTAIGICVLLLGYPTFLGYRAYRLPWIYDITTDTDDPPRYEALARIRPRDANPVAYPGGEVANLQSAAYPDLDTLETESNPLAAYNAALQVINKRRWTVVLRRPPEPRRDGQIEAVSRSLIMGFRDDIVVRIRPDDDGARVDVRSSARYGEFDFGANAERIRGLIDEIDDAISNQKPERPAAPPPKKAAPVAKRGGGNQKSTKR
jgi:uncharacterized protein (DUF1499 family)